MLTHTQLADLAQLHQVAETFSADVAIIGAAALLCFVDIRRFTRDIDLVVALDLEDFNAFADQLRSLGWTQEASREHRWHGPRGSIIDLLPAGPALRQARRIRWPESGFEMSLVGFEHVFVRALPFSFEEGVQYRVAPPPVIALLKIVAFMDDRNGRRKDLLDVAELFRRSGRGMPEPPPSKPEGNCIVRCAERALPQQADAFRQQSGDSRRSSSGGNRREWMQSCAG